MNSNIIGYLEEVIYQCSRALSEGRASMSGVLPCLVCRELEVTENPFVSGSDPIMASYKSLLRNQRFSHVVVPRKIEFGAAVYLKEGLIDLLFGKSNATIVFIGDSNSDKRFAYNSRRLLATFPQGYKFYCFIANSELVSPQFGASDIVHGWDEEHFYYHAKDWGEIEVMLDVIKQGSAEENIVSVIDMDGTLLCPRPEFSSVIKAARLDALIEFCGEEFQREFFDKENQDDVGRLRQAYSEASDTAFNMSYDDADLTALIALGLYGEIINKGDRLLNPINKIGFVLPIEWLHYASFVMENHGERARELSRLRSLFVSCADAVLYGSASAFKEFRVYEEKVLRSGSEQDNVPLSRSVIEYILETAKLGAISIGFSDRPEASLGLEPTNNIANTCAAKQGASLYTTGLPLR